MIVPLLGAAAALNAANAARMATTNAMLAASRARALGPMTSSTEMTGHGQIEVRSAPSDVALDDCAALQIPEPSVPPAPQKPIVSEWQSSEFCKGCNYEFGRYSLNSCCPKCGRSWRDGGQFADTLNRVWRYENGVRVFRDGRAIDDPVDMTPLILIVSALAISIVFFAMALKV